MVEPIQLAHRAVEVASDKQGTDIVLLDLRGLSSFMDFFVIVTAETPRQIDAILEETDTILSGMGAVMHHKEGKSTSGWVLADFGDVVVHVFSPEERNYYSLEDVWGKAPTLIRVQ